MRVDISNVDRQQFPFNNFDDKYRCCCRSVHVKQGTTIIGILSTILLAVFFIYFLYEMNADIDRRKLFVIRFTFYLGFYFTNFLCRISPFELDEKMFEMCYMAFEFMALILLFVGLFKNKKNYLLAFIVSKIFGVILCLLMVITATVTNARPGNDVGALIRDQIQKTNPYVYVHTMQISHWSIILLIWSLLITIVTVWFINVIYRCYIYLRDMESNQSDDTKPVQIPRIALV